MVFSSLIFLYAFFPLSLLAYFLCKGKRSQNAVLLVSSLIFYAWGEPKYVLLLMFMALVSWFFALKIEQTRNPNIQTLYLTLTVIVDISLIAYFKYASMICGLFGPVPEAVRNIALPIGISFYTFQLLTYVVDVYRAEAPAQDSYFNVLLYAALFHQCIAGPIVRYASIDRELFGHRTPELAAGVSRFSAGLAKKVLLANPCGALADALILPASTASNPQLLAENLSYFQNLSVLGAWVGIIAFSLHIYLDFSAYSDMAIGMGKMLGLHYPENFRYPYISRPVTEFWRRWHISLGTFFRDYVYMPQGDITNTVYYSTIYGSGQDYPMLTVDANWSDDSKYSVFGTDWPINHLENRDQKGKPNCIVVKDSFGNCFLPFLTQNFENIYAVDYRKFRDMPLIQLAEAYDCDYVIFMPYLAATQSVDGPSMISNLCHY